MTTIRRLLVTATALPLALLAPTSAGADTPSATTFHGIFTSRAFTNCENAPSVGDVSGTWNIIKRGETNATVSINIFVDGMHHVSFGGSIPQTNVPGSTVSVDVQTGAGPLTISLTGEVLTYTISPYDLHGRTVTGDCLGADAGGIRAQVVER
jgi:hypothetical protein